MISTRPNTSRTVRRLSRIAIVAVMSAGIAACGNDDAPVVEEFEVTTLPDNAIEGDELTAVFGATEIPYPVYPNGDQYRVGGENGLKIVVFQTEDSFDEVDAYYQSLSEEQGMPRLMAMNDYVRYSSDSADEDPWATYRPGIVIHEFDDDGERQAVGANGSARTNIIMSF